MSPLDRVIVAIWVALIAVILTRISVALDVLAGLR